MKIINRILLAAAVAGSLTLAINAKANDNGVFLSPRAKANQIRLAPASTSRDPDLVTEFAALAGTPKTKAVAPNCCAVATSQNDPDLLREQRQIVYTGKNPARDLSPMEFQIAPLMK